MSPYTAEFVAEYRLRLVFSDQSSGVMGFDSFVQAGAAMTEPLGDTDTLRRFHIELGALCWPNGFELSAGSLQKRLEAAGLLQRSSAAA